MEITIHIQEFSPIMIRPLKEDEVDLIDPILNKFGQESESSLPPNFINQIKTSTKEGKSFLYGAFINDDKLEGIGMFGNISKRISFVYAAGNSDVEIQLVNTVFHNHSDECEFVGAAGPWVTDTISNQLVEIGFRKLNRAFMTLDRNSIESLETPIISEEMEFEVYDNSHIDEVSKLVFKGNDGYIDQIVFPNFFGSIESCKTLIANIEKDVYGEYKEPYSWLLRKEGKLIGACLMTIRENGQAGYIPDIVIDPDYQGQGLGKAMLIHSMKEILTGFSDMVKIDLDVTLENDAKYLYKSLGFESVREYSMYTWTNPRE